VKGQKIEHLYALIKSSLSYGSETWRLTENNPLMPELNPSEQRCLPEFLLGILNFNAHS